MKKNTIYCIDALEGLRQLEDKSIDLIITSPPYNKGNIKKGASDIWEKSINYDNYNDNLEEDKYQRWQVEILNECFRVLKDEGSFFYNHKVRVRKNRIIHPLEWITKSKFNCRQIITWDRGSSPNVSLCRYIPTTELIFWLTKTRLNPRFKRENNAMFQTEVWRFPALKNSEHPAPFPIELPDNIIPSVAQGEKITVLDPFIGCGTVAVSAIKNNCDYIGFEISENYINLFYKHLKIE